jgi:putative ABC transport system permease protein
VPVRNGGELTRLRRALVSGDWFAVLGTEPLLGRALRPEDDVRGAPAVVVLSHRAWQERFGGARDIVGRRLVTHGDDVTYTIVGVMPRGLDFPRGTDLWAAMAPAIPVQNLPYAALNVVGRLAPAATPERARDEMTAWYGREGAPPHERDFRGTARTLPELVLGDTGRAVLVFAAAAGILLLVTCINVGNLLLVRGLARVREVAVRTALGARRGRVVRQLVAEHALLAVAGGVLGVLVAAAATGAFVALAPSGLPRVDEIGLDGTALAAALGLTGLAMLLFAIAPALVATRVELPQVLRSGTRQSAGRGARRTTELLVVGQVALALVVLSAAGLLARSFASLRSAELAFDPSRLVVAELALRHDRYGTPLEQRALVERLLPAVQGLPGVRAVTPVVAVPFSGTHGWDGRFGAEGQPPERAASGPMLNMEVVAPSYFPTFGVPIERGRAFTDDDREGTDPVVVISASTARHFWPDADPIGRRLTLGPAAQQRKFTVVGVVPDTRYRDLRDPRASIYFPLRQSFFPFVPTTLVLRMASPDIDARAALERVLAEAAPGVALASAASLATFMEGPLAQPRLNALLLAAFAAAAVALAAIGLFGVTALTVRQRTREMGVRMALGASAGDVARLVLRRGMALAAAGTALGLLGAFVANRALGALLFDVAPTDALTLGAVAVGLLTVAAIASALPARASTRIEPSAALRAE